MAVKINLTKVASLTIPEDYSLSGDNENAGISQSLLGTYQVCRRKFLFAVNRWINPAGEWKYAYGNLCHDLLMRMYNCPELNYKKPEHLKMITEHIRKYSIPAIIDREQAEVWKAYATACFEAYPKVYAKDWTEKRTIEAEKKFDLKWLGYRLRGKKDLRIYDKNKKIWLGEHKNYRQIGEEQMLLRLSFDLQNMFYLLADRIEHPKDSAIGIIYNIIRKPDVRKFKKPSEIYTFLKGEIAKNPEHYFIRFEVPYASDTCQQFERELCFKLDELNGLIKRSRSASKPLDVFYKNECACNLPYECEFLKACSSGNMQGYTQKKQLFTELNDEV